LIESAVRQTSVCRQGHKNSPLESGDGMTFAGEKEGLSVIRD